MRMIARGLLFAVASPVLSACHFSALEQRLALEPRAARVSAASPVIEPADRRQLAEQWSRTGIAALEHPTEIALPYSDWGGFLVYEPTAVGLSFDALAGQRLIARIAVLEPDASTPDDNSVFVEVFRPDTRGDDAAYTLMATLEPGQSMLEVEIPARAHYVVRLRSASEPRSTAFYHLTLELDSALPFPLRHHDEGAIRDVFGASRDGGVRRHKGIDIFARRFTPVLAVVDGVARPADDVLGGKTVLLSSPDDVSYYYAHLAQRAIRAPTRVKAGDVLGYVGNTGNAAKTPSHLHFGVFHGNRGAVDPEPMLASRLLPEREADYFDPQQRRVLEDRLTLHRAPTVESLRAEALHAAELSRQEPDVPSGVDDAPRDDHPGAAALAPPLPTLFVAQTPSFRQPPRAIETGYANRIEAARRLAF